MPGDVVDPAVPKALAWASARAVPAREVINRYFDEVPRLTDQVGVAEAEQLTAAAAKEEGSLR
ncbi:hypothetical protein [Streptomyces sp. YIM S03343]